MKKKILMFLCVALLSLCGTVASGNVVEKQTTITFAEIPSIQDCKESNSITDIDYGDFTISFSSSNLSANTLFYKAEYGIVVFYLGSYDASTRRGSSGDCMVVTNKKGYTIKKVEVNVTTLDDNYNILSPQFFTYPNMGTTPSGLNCIDNPRNNYIFVHVSPTAFYLYQKVKTYAYMKSVTITTEEPEEEEDEQFRMSLENVDFEAVAARTAKMTFDLHTSNDYIVDQYRVVVCDPEDETQVYCDERFRHDVPETSTEKLPARETLNRVINGSVTLKNLNRNGETPVMIRVIPEAAVYEHADNPTVSTPLSTGTESIEAEEAEAPAQYFDINGMPVNNPSKGGLYILKKGTKVSKHKL